MSYGTVTYFEAEGENMGITERVETKSLPAVKGESNTCNFAVVV